MQKRAFIAINLPEGARQRVCSELCSQIPKEKFRVVKRENLHLTLCFLGSIGEERLAELRRGLRSLNGFGALEIELAGIGSFGRNVLWLGVSSGREELEGLHARVREAIGFNGERLSAHLTLARNRNASAGEVRRVVENLNSKKFAEKIMVRSVELMESVLSPRGPEYKEIESFPL